MSTKRLRQSVANAGCFRTNSKTLNHIALICVWRGGRDGGGLGQKNNPSQLQNGQATPQSQLKNGGLLFGAGVEIVEPTNSEPQKGAGKGGGRLLTFPDWWVRDRVGTGEGGGGGQGGGLGGLGWRVGGRGRGGRGGEGEEGMAGEGGGWLEGCLLLPCHPPACLGVPASLAGVPASAAGGVPASTSASARRKRQKQGPLPTEAGLGMAEAGTPPHGSGDPGRLGAGWAGCWTGDPELAWGLCAFQTLT